jgi:AcrR family transcriptional regulator
VAAAAGVSVGLVQHYFANKAGLIKAVDDDVLGLAIAAVAPPIPEPPADSIADMGSRVTRIVAEQPDIMDYVGRALVDGSPLGTNHDLRRSGCLWHGPVESTKERAETRPDLDLTWAALNSLVLALGALILRGHIERQLPEPFTTSTQLQRWQDSVNTLLREGLYRRTGSES